MSPRKADPPALEFVLLGLIRLQPVHGYELFHSFQRDHGVGMIWQVKPAHMYAVLDKLEGMGWLESEIQTGEGSVQRKQYHITAAGEQSYQNWLTSPVTTPHRLRQEFLARLYFILHDPQKPGTAIIFRQMEICGNWQIRMQQQIQKLAADQFYEREVLLFRIGQVSAMQEWLINLEKSLDGQTQKAKEMGDQNA